MGRVKWNTFVNPRDTNMNNVQKSPPDCLKNFMPHGGYMRNPLNIMGTALKNAAMVATPPPSGDNQSAGQPGQSSREGTFDYKNMPGQADGTPQMRWNQKADQLVRSDRNNQNAIGITSNLTDLPSVWARKYTSQN